MSSPLSVILCLILTVNTSFSQTNKAQVVPWFFPGVIYQANKKIEIWGQYGYNYRQGIHALYLQSFIKTGRHFIFNPAYLYLNIQGPNGTRLQEHTLMNAVICTFKINQIVIDDRNMIWNRFRLYGKDIHFYRNRLRFALPFTTHRFLIKPYLFDEVTFSFNDGRFTRNRLAVGLSCKVTKWSLLDVTWLREYDKLNGNTNLFFVTGLLELSHRKVERNSQQK